MSSVFCVLTYPVRRRKVMPSPAFGAAHYGPSKFLRRRLHLIRLRLRSTVVLASQWLCEPIDV